MFEYLEEIDNGSLRRAHRMSHEGSIWDCIEKGYVYGEEESVNGEVFYKNLVLTKSGKDLLRFCNLKLEDIDNAHGKNSVKEWLIKPVLVAVLTAAIATPISGVIGFYLGKVMAEQAAKQDGSGQATLNIATEAEQ
jgi:hypothetical protein